MNFLSTKFSLRYSLFAIIAFIGATAFIAQVTSAHKYEEFIYKIEHSSIKDLIELKATDLNRELVDISTELGIVLQKDKGLRKAIKKKDIAAIVPFLNDHFHQYFVTAGVISLQKIYLLDTQYQHLAQSSDGMKNISLKQPICNNTIADAKNRTGINHLKAISSMCRKDQTSLLSVIVPVGTLKPIAYLQIVTDPSYNAHQISSNLHMPIQVKRKNTSLIKETDDWPINEKKSNFIFVDYPIIGKTGDVIYRLTAAKDITAFREAFQSTNKTILSFSIPIILLGLAAALFVSKRTLSALKDLAVSAEETSQGNYNKIAPSLYKELNQVINSFNHMSDKVKNNERYLEQEIDSATQKLRDAMGLIEKRNEELQATINLVEKANTTKSSFLANMSHELRTPLNAVIGYSEMLTEDLEDLGKDDLVSDVNKIHSAGTHLLGLVNDILDLSKVEAGKLELSLTDIDLNTIIKEMVFTVMPLAKENNNEIIINTTEDFATIHSDSMRLKQIILNIINNAVKFTSNGKIEITLRSDTYLENEVYYIDIKDTGIGIDTKLVEKLFQPFYQADESATRKFGGTGLGLALSKQLVEGLGGNISVASTDGEGSTFTIRLPKQIYV